MIAMQGCYQGLFGRWFVPWLKDTQGLARSEAAQWLPWAAIAYAAGSIFFGPGSDRMAERGISRLTLLKWGSALCVASFAAPCFAPRIPKFAMLACYAFGSIASGLCYAILSRRFPLSMTGRLNTALNVSMFLCAFAVQIGAGMLLRLFPADDGRYAAEAYVFTFAVLGAVQLVAWLFVAGVKEEKAG